MKLIREIELPNTLNLKIFDHSRIIAADRWYVKIICTVTMPVNDGYFVNQQGDSPELAALIRQYIGNELVMELVQERNFVDDKVVEKVSRELQERISENMTGYLGAGTFPARFFAMKYAEAKKACLHKIAMGADRHGEEDEEPVDFSACFQD